MSESMFKFSCADFTFPLLSHGNALQLIRLLGIDAVDLGLFEGRSHIYPSMVTNDLRRTVRDVIRDLSSAGLVVGDVFLQTGVDPHDAAANSPDKSVRLRNREVFQRIIEFAKLVGSNHITGLPGVYHMGQNSKDDWKRAVEEAKWRVETSWKAGITYSIEAHVGSLLHDTETTLTFVKCCPDLTLTLDYGHFIYQGHT